MNMIENLSSFVTETKFDDIPVNVVERAKQCILDTIAVALYGSQFESSIIASAVIMETGGKKESTIIGTNKKAPVFLAALVNGISSHTAEYDDDLFDFLGHPSCILMPVVLSLSEKNMLDGKSMLASFILGNETGSIIGNRMGWEHYRTGFHPTGTIGTIAASAAASKLLNLSAKETANALGIAASSASGLRENFGTMTKSWHAGHAASGGIMASLLAQKGYNSSLNSLEGESGFIKVFQGKKEVLSDIKVPGKPYSILDVVQKRYPSGAASHPAVDAVLYIIKKNSIQPEDIQTIQCYVRPMVLSILKYKYPENKLEAKFSLEYSIAAAVVFGSLGIDQFTDKVVNKPRVKEMIKKIFVIPDEKLETIAVKENLLSPVKIIITLKTGKIYNTFKREAKGGPQSPFHWRELEDKFSECSENVLSKFNAQSAVTLIKNLEEVKNINNLTELLSNSTNRSDFSSEDH